ncbi:MAG TPA: tetratricopeptide repeat protein [Methylibium sp.]|uniref:tetratricopeptide repeat protein n=1 Tax=Methylibium sp. TaxID=2067992 RepID=UPI002DBE8A63|nr:tetratricopeptide repeat protein [Methylibium sp.]HEU4457908.1 tetratricopeptide repeat protein [Methylibium sp.]
MASPLAAAGADNSRLDASLFYQLLIGEIELNRGDVGTGFQVLLDAARKTRDERLFRRATEVALEARAGDQALDAARAWRQTLPASIEAHRYEAQLLVALNRVAETATPLRSLLALVPNAQRADAIASLPGFFGRGGDRKAASSAAAGVLEQVLAPYAEGGGEVRGSIPPTAAEQSAVAVAAWVALGRVRAAAGDAPRALEAARRAKAADPAADAPALLAIELLGAEPAAEALVTEHLAAAPASPTGRSAVRLGYARALALAQRYADAAPQIEAVTRESPQFVDAWLTLGALQVELKQPEAAEAALRKYLSLIEAETKDAPDPAAAAAVEADDDAASPSQRLAQAYLLLAQAAEQKRDFKAAEEWLSKVDSSQALAVQSRRASLLAQQGRLADARALIRKLPERTPDDARAKLLAEVQLMRDQKQWPAAYELLGQMNQRYREDTDLLYEQAMMAEKLDRLGEMEQLLRRVIALKPQQPQAYNALGYSLADRKQRLDEARQLINKAIELSPGDPFLIDSLGWVEYRLGNHDEALKWLGQAYRMRPDAEIGAHLGEVLWVVGKRDEARRVLAEARARDAGNDVLKETLARLKVDL